MTIKKKQTGCRKNDRRAAKEKKYMEFGSMPVIIDIYFRKLPGVCDTWLFCRPERIRSAQNGFDTGIRKGLFYSNIERYSNRSGWY